MKKLFGTDGMRGHAGEFPLDQATIKTVGNSLARRFFEKNGRLPRFIIGRDTRESGEWIEKAFAEGARTDGARCESAGVITTPGIAFLTRQFEFDAGIVISASHNPFQDNGIKIFLPDGKKLDEATERAIEKDIYAGQNPPSAPPSETTADSAGESVGKFQKTYLEHLTGEFSTLDLKDFKLVIDCANGAAYAFAPVLFGSFGGEIICFNSEPDGRNINENCGSLHLEKLREKVLAEKADFGAAFDGDADRALFVDENGDLIDGDATLWIMANYLNAHGKLNHQTVVATVMSNIGLEIALASREMKLLRTAVGDKYVLEELLKTGSSIGGEQSGHIIFPQESLVGDGMRTTLCLLQAIRSQNLTLAAAAAGFKRYPQILVNVKVREKQPFADVAQILKASNQIEDELGGKGRLLLRYSGTENLARVMIEGENQTEIESQAHRLADVIKLSLG